MASMIEEIEVPQDPKLWTCTCCKFSFRAVNDFADHLVSMKAKIEADLAKVKAKIEADLAKAASKK